MKCPKCGYLAFESAERCRNCGYDLSLGAGQPSNVDPPLKPTSEPQEPDVDFKFFDEALPKIEGRRPIEALDLDRLIGAPGPTSDLPLFPSEKPDDAPLISAPVAPRAPLAVRRSTPEVPRLRSRNSQAETPELPMDLPTRSASRLSAARAVETSGADAPADAVFWRRFAAGALDATILVGIDLAVIYFTLRLCDLTLAEFAMLPIAPLAAFLLLLDGGYSVAFTAVGGQTIGRMALGIKVVGDANQPIDLGHATLRTLTYLASWLPLGLGLLPALIGENRRPLHDRVANTQVVQVARP